MPQGAYYRGERRKDEAVNETRGEGVEEQVNYRGQTAGDNWRREEHELIMVVEG